MSWGSSWVGSVGGTFEDQQGGRWLESHGGLSGDTRGRVQMGVGDQAGWLRVGGSS